MKVTSIFLLLFLCLGLTAQSISTKVQNELDELVLADVREGSPGLAVGVIKKGKVVYEKYAGLADIKSGRLIDEQTRFNLASLAKQFTALCILKLSEDGQLSLDDDVRKYLPSLLTNIKEPITITQLLNHSSGIRDISNLLGLKGITWWKAKWDNDDALKLLNQQTSLNFSPGSKKLYSNSNYILLAHIVERVSGQPFKAYAENLFRSLSMPSTIFHDNFREPVENVAEPYFNFKTWYNYDLRSDLHGDGALYSATSDQLNWEIMLQKALRSAAAKDAWLVRSQEPLAGDGSYGFGLEFGQYRGIPYRYHAGSTGAWKAITLRFPEQELSVFVATNSGAIWPPGLARDCADLLLEIDDAAKDSIRTEPAVIGPALSTEEIIGVYRTTGGYFCEIKMKENTLYLERMERDDIIIENVQGSLFRETTDHPFKQHFYRNEEGKMILSFYYPGEESYDFIKQTESSDSPVPAALNGKYINKETGAKITIKHLAGNTYDIKVGKRKNRVGKCYGPNEIVLPGYRLEIGENTAGEVTHLLLFDNRLKRVRFNRKK